MATIGRKRIKSRKRVRKIPKVPMKVKASTQVGEYIRQADGRKSRCNEITKITNRSNHMPALAHIETKKTMVQFLRKARTHISCGITTLQANIVQDAHQYGPK